MLRGHDRFQALAELSTQTYSTGCWLEPEVRDQELAAIPHDETLLELAAGIADDLAVRDAAAERDETHHWPDASKVDFVLAPLLQSGRPIEPRWDGLVVLEQGPEARRLLEALPLERREARIRAHFTRNSNPSPHAA
jgi:hypothetical protein